MDFHPASVTSELITFNSVPAKTIPKRFKFIQMKYQKTFKDLYLDAFAAYTHMKMVSIAQPTPVLCARY